MPISPPRAWAEVDLSALHHNLQLARAASGCRIMAVVKAGAYGHGLEEIATSLAAADIAFFGVANVGEARRIAATGVRTRIYLLGATWDQERAEIVERDWTPCLSNFEEARHFSQLASSAGKTLKVHLAVDTGMGRGGFVGPGLPEILAGLEKLPGLEIEGIGSHLPSADEDAEFTRAQFECFSDIVRQLGGRDRFKWIHLSNSAGLLGYNNSLFNLARPGLMLYGTSPLPEEAWLQPPARSGLRPVMSLKSRVTLIRTLPAGHGVSYGRDYITKKETRVATIGIGYGDGLPRSLSGKGAEVHGHGRRFPIIGRITMDQLMVSLEPDDTLEVGAEVEVFGSHISIAEVARKAGTIPWEILTGITPRVTRIHLDVAADSIRQAPLNNSKIP